MSNDVKPLVFFQHQKLAALVEHPHAEGIRFSEEDVIPFLQGKFGERRVYDKLYNGELEDPRDKLYSGELKDALDGFEIDVKEINSLGGVTFDWSAERCRVLSFSTPENVTYSMATFSFEYPTGSLMADNPGDSREQLERDDTYLLYLTGELNAVLASVDRAEDTPQLRAIAPNWLFAGGQSQVSTGGPGSKPARPTGLPSQSSEVAKHYEFAVRDQGLSTSRAALPDIFPHFKTFKERFDSTGSSEPVKVAILDTAPSQAALAKASADFGEQNPLLTQLIGSDGTPTGNFEIIYYSNRNASDFKDTGLKDHDYEMPDHGLFIAGIIRTLAPEAHIRLIQVLNDYCVGTMDALSWGITHLRDWILESGGITVVNSSLTITFPFDESQMNPAEMSWMEVIGKILCKIMKGALKNLLVFNVRMFYELLKMPDTMLFAAAGNDGEKNKAETEARYPAAFEGVYGVGAWGAYYSNKADVQPEERFLAFGGDADNLATDGVLGLYTHPEFPDQSLNELGLARWAGTSFATAIATGTHARLVWRGCTNDQAKTLMQRVVQEDKEPPPDKGNVLPVRQGP